MKCPTSDIYSMSLTSSAATTSTASSSLAIAGATANNKTAKLSRSQSIGVGGGGGGNASNGGGGVAMGSADKALMPRPPEGRPAIVVLLDERRLELTIQPRVYAGELLDLVAQQCGLKEKVLN